MYKNVKTHGRETVIIHIKNIYISSVFTHVIKGLSSLSLAMMKEKGADQEVFVE